MAENVFVAIDLNLLESRQKGKKSLRNELLLPRQQDWAVSPFGNTIDLYFSKSFNWVADSSPLLIIGGVHGDEPEGVILAESILRWLNHNPDIHQSWAVIPCINPDGYFRNVRVNHNGVDLNRNFPSRDWSPSFKTSRYFPGTHPCSEPEVRALVKFIMTYKPRLIIHCHSWHPSITYTGRIAPEEAIVLSKSTGYPLQEDIGYPTPGSLGQFAWLEYHIPVICIEEQEHVELSTVWPRFEAGIKQIFGRQP